MILHKPRYEDYDRSKYGDNAWVACVAYIDDCHAYDRNVRRAYVIGVVLFVAICAAAWSVIRQ